MSGKTTNHENVFLDRFVSVWHPSHVTIQMILVFLLFGGHLGICKLDSEDAILQMANIGI